MDVVLINSPFFQSLQGYIDEAVDLASARGMILLRISKLDFTYRGEGVRKAMDEYFWTLEKRGFRVLKIKANEVPADFPGTPSLKDADLFVAVRSEMRMDAGLPAEESKPFMIDSDSWRSEWNRWRGELKDELRKPAEQRDFGKLLVSTEGLFGGQDFDFSMPAISESSS